MDIFWDILDCFLTGLGSLFNGCREDHHPGLVAGMPWCHGRILKELIRIADADVKDDIISGWYMEIIWTSMG